MAVLDVVDESPEAPIERTASQSLKFKALQQARHKIHNTEAPVSQLKHDIARVGGEDQGAKDVLSSLESLRKRARNYSEDILEETLKLDSLTNLLPEDRVARKETLRQADLLVEGLDSMKAELAALQRRFASAPTSAEERTATEDKKLASHVPAQATPPPVQSAARTEAEVPLPPASLWTKVRLPLSFSAQEGVSRYVLPARSHAVDTKSLRLRLIDGGATLSISGVCAPSAEEAADMQQEVTRYMQATRSKVGVPTLYAQLAHGTYGSFAETVRLPEDVDVHAIHTTYENNVLQVVLPKSPPRSARQSLNPHLFQGRSMNPSVSMGFPSFFR
jgi:hypothetical protein